MAKFGDMSSDEQKVLCTKIAECLKANDLGDIPVTLYREEVCQLTSNEVVGKMICKVEKDLPETSQAKVDKFKEDVKEIVGESDVQIKVACPIGAGSMYKTITNVTTLEDDQTPVSIEHTKGEVLMIDFWATWCPPCQRPMQHNQDMLTANEAAWGDKVKIIGLSIDGDAATVQNHITTKGWTKPIHYWKSKSDCSDVYSVNGVPHVMLIDTNGKIVFKGHPAGRQDLAADMTALLAGETISGEGCAPAEPVEGEANAPASLPEGYKASTDEEMAAILEAMTDFKVTGKQLQEECKTEAVGMMRNFCVMTLSAQFSATTMSWSTEFTNHRVLVGSQAKIDFCNEKIKAKMPEAEALYTVNEQLMAR